MVLAKKFWQRSSEHTRTKTIYNINIKNNNNNNNIQYMQVIEEGRQEGGRLLREWGLSWGSWGGEVGGEGGGGGEKKKKKSTPPPKVPRSPSRFQILDHNSTHEANPI